MAAHSVISPSSAHRWMQCPGSVKLSQLAADKPRSQYADRGSVAHKLAEQCLLRGEKADKYLNHWGLVVKGEVTLIKNREKGDAHIIDQKMVDDVQLYVSGIQAIRKTKKNAIFHVEERVRLPWIASTLHGTADCVIRDPLKTIQIIDYKNGVTYVDERENPQLMIYALGALGEDNPTMAEKVIMTVVQPNGQGDPIRSYGMKVSELNEWGQETLKKAVELVHVSYPLHINACWQEKYLHPGKWCKWCNAEAVCPVNTKDVINGMFGVDEIPIAMPPVPAEHEKLFKHYAAIPRLKDWIAAVEKECRGYLIDNGSAYGWKVIQGLGHRKFRDPEAAAKTLENILGKGVYAPQKLKSPLAIREMWLAKGHASKIFDSLVEKPLGKIKIVSTDHSAPALPGKKHMFGGSNE